MTTPNDLNTWLSAPTRLSALAQAIRAKVPTSDVEDVVQSTLADALTAAEPPADPAAFDRWLFGIARHKIADYYRRHRRHEIVDSDVVAASTYIEPVPESAADLLRWVDQELPKEPETTRTLEWMMREASGDRLETIAKEHDIAAPTVRQRVSRLRRYLRERWAIQLAAALGLLVVVTGLFAYRHQHDQPVIVPDVARAPTPVERAEDLRKTALEACRAGEWKPCLEDLDRARELDPAGDTTNAVQEARVGASRALAPQPSPSLAPTPSLAPIQSAAPNRTAPPRQIKPTIEKKHATPVKSEPPFEKMTPTQSNVAPSQLSRKAALEEQTATKSNVTPSSVKSGPTIQIGQKQALPKVNAAKK